jgi:predicted CxxxxCH...CXXCH cytochrome family protein
MKSGERAAGFAWLVCSLVLGLYLALVAPPAHAQPQYVADCTDCHTMPPLDALNADKDPDSGAVPGNHQKHATGAVDSCAKCHGDAVKSYATGHRNKTIEFNSALGYDGKRGNAFLNQTSVPPNPLGGCSTAACHSNGKGAYRTSPAWGSSAPASCDTCHDSAPATGSHQKHIATYSYGCVKCHSDHAAETKTFAHATSAGRAIDVHFTAAPNSGGSFSGTDCSNLYCHSNGRGGAANAAATWGSSADCASCHGIATSTGPAALSAKHAKHVNNAAFLGNNLNCRECHAPTVSGDTVISDRSKHVDGSVSFGGAKLGSVAAGSCSTSYCHSDGKGAQKTVTWTQTATLSCNGCHGTGNAFGAPDYVNGGAGLANANSHAKHATSAGDCVNCHSKTTVNGTSIVAGSQHIDQFINFTSGNGKSFGKQANKTCSNISCHSGNGIVQNVAPAQWGATLDCLGCHATLTSAHAAHTGTYGCLSCHADSVTSNTALKAGGAHMNAAINVAGAKITTFTLADQSCATSCHTGASAPKWNVAASGQCGSCHNVTSPLIASNAHAQHFTAANGPRFSQDVNGCQVCHSYSGERTHVDGVKNMNAGFAANGGCSSCHKQSSTQWSVAASVTCESCHSTAGGALSVINKTAPDKTLNATKGHGAQGQSCVACHDSASSHIGVAGGTSRLNAGLTGSTNAECNFCHGNSQKVTRTLNIPAHRASGPGSQCADCHDPHGTANTMMVKASINATAVSFTGNNTFANGAQNGVCQVCHTTTKYFTKSGVTPQAHVDSTANCLDCHKHNPASGLAFTPTGGCDACHGYPPAPRNLSQNFGVQSNWSGARFEDYSGGGGAHTLVAHLSKDIKPSDGWAPCLACHSGGDAAHAKVLPIRDHVENVTVKLDPQFRFSNKRQLAYSSAVLASGGANRTGSCFNVSCHFKKSKQWSSEK